MSHLEQLKKLGNELTELDCKFLTGQLPEKEYKEKRKKSYLAFLILKRELERLGKIKQKRFLISSGDNPIMEVTEPELKTNLEYHKKHMPNVTYKEVID